MKLRRVVDENDDLEVLDPTTGEALVVEASASTTGRGDRSTWSARGRRLRRLRLVFAVLSLTAVGLAAYTGWSIATLRRVEGTWQRAMSFDSLRGSIDETIYLELERFDADDDTTASFLAGIGVAASAELAKAEATLDDMDVRDDRTAELRDAMVEALEFRQRQMSPQRRRLGDTPLIAVERRLSAELRRWRLEPSAAPVVRLAAGDDVVNRLRRFVDDPTSTVLVALGTDGLSLTMIDIDASSITRRSIPVVADRLLAIAPDVVIAMGANGVSAYTLDSHSSAGPLWERPGAAAYAAPGDEALWIHQGADALRLEPRGQIVAGPFTLPSGMKPVGATRNGLVLITDPPTLNDNVILWSPEGDRRQPLGGAVRRFIGAGHGLVVVERQVVLESSGGGLRQVLDYAEVVADTGRAIDVIEFEVPLLSVAQRPGGTEIAATGGPPAGRLARVFRFTLPGAQPTRGPNASVDPGALAWSPTGNHLFWVTPDGKLTIYDPARGRAAQVRADVHPVGAIVAFESQR